MTTIPTGTNSFSQLGTLMGVSGTVSMSQIAPLVGLSKSAVKISAFANKQQITSMGLQYRVFGMAPFTLDIRNGSYNNGPTSISNGTTSYPSSYCVKVSDGTLKINGNTIPQGIQIWTVPVTGSYSIACGGAAGGVYGTNLPGYGMVTNTTYSFTAGQYVCILVGQQAYGNAGSAAAGGGGGTFVTIYAGTGAFSTASQHTVILVAGGGGGVGNTSGANATSLTSGTLAPQYSGTVATNGGGGGGAGLAGGNAADGSGRNSIEQTYEGSGAGGAGFIGAGGYGSNWTGRTTAGGNSFLNGGVGGYGFIGSGGFGGGGASWNSGGGGGGYSGGQGPSLNNRQGGGGGGSYNINGTSYNATQLTSWSTTYGNTAPSTYSSGWCTGNGFCIIAPLLSAYFADDTTWFDTKTENYVGLTSIFSGISASTGGSIDGVSTIWLSTFSVELFGYFYAPTTETYTFYTSTDDASYLWIGSTALVGYTTTNCIVNNGSTHGTQQRSGTIALTAGTYYPIRVQQGNNGGPYELIVGFSTPTIAYTTNLTGYVYTGVGTSSLFPGNSARLIRAAINTNTDGIYYINVNGVSTPTYCLMDSKWDGGGWMMMMKASRYSSTTTSTSLYVSGIYNQSILVVGTIPIPANFQNGSVSITLHITGNKNAISSDMEGGVWIKDVNNTNQLITIRIGTSSPTGSFDLTTTTSVTLTAAQFPLQIWGGVAYPAWFMSNINISVSMTYTYANIFTYSSTYWTDTSTTLNATDTTRTTGDAKYNIMNYGMIKDVMALWPDVGYTGGSIAQSDSWSWLVNNYYNSGTRCTAITGFSAANGRDSPVCSDPTTYAGFSTSIWSSQSPAKRHIFGSGSYIGSNTHVRWGFIFNENGVNDFASCDANGGIGMGSYSAGDYYYCCGSVALNRNMRVELYGR